MLCFWVLMWTEMLLSTIRWLCMGNNIFFPLLEIFYWIPVQLFLAVWRLGVYLSVGTGAVRAVADSSLGIVVGHPSCLCFCTFPRIIFLWTGHFCSEFEQGFELHACLTCVVPSLFHPPSAALGKRFAGSDHKIELLSLFPCQTSLLLTAAEQPSSGHSLHSQTAGTLAVNWKY